MSHTLTELLQKAIEKRISKKQPFVASDIFKELDQEWEVNRGSVITGVHRLMNTRYRRNVKVKEKPSHNHMPIKVFKVS